MLSRIGHRLYSKFGALRVFIWGDDSEALPLGSILVACFLGFVFILGFADFMSMIASIF